MKQPFKKAAVVLAISAVCLAGCGGKKEADKELQYSVVTLGDTDITVGKTTLRELKDAGFAIAKNEMLTTPLDESQEMPGRTYDVGIYLAKDDMQYAKVQCLNDKDEAIPYLDSIVNNITVYYQDARSPYVAPYYHESVKIDGIGLKGLTPEKALEQIGETKETPSETNFPDGGVAGLSYQQGDCYFILSFDYDTGLTSECEVEMFHSHF